MTPFKINYIITQLFGVNPQNYSQYGLAGHEGLDLVPADANGNQLPLVAGKDNWDILAVEDGEVVRDVDDPRSGNYGEYCVVLNRQTGRAWWYCHMQRNDVSIGQQIKRGDRLGLMGATGNATGAHLHLGLRLADANGNAINANNGYKGFVDPKEALESFNKNSPFPSPDQPIPTPPPAPQPDERIKKWNDLAKIVGVDQTVSVDQMYNAIHNNPQLEAENKKLTETILDIRQKTIDSGV